MAEIVQITGEVAQTPSETRFENVRVTGFDIGVKSTSKANKWAILMPNSNERIIKHKAGILIQIESEPLQIMIEKYSLY